MKRSLKKVIHEIEFKKMSFAREVSFFEDVSFKFPMETVVWVRGESGAGKSTLLRLLAGLESITSGELLINGEDVSEMSFEEFLPYRLGIGFSFDLGGLINNRSLFDNLMLPILYHQEMDYSEASQWVLELMSAFGVESYKEDRPAMVSGRIRKSVVVMRSLVLRPSTLLMDEPLTGMSREMISALVTTISVLQAKWGLKNIVIATGHEMFGDPTAHDVVEVRERKLIFADQRQELREKIG